MKKVLLSIFFIAGIGCSLAQIDTVSIYKKRVLETSELDFLMSYYTQEGSNAAVTGGIGTEELTDVTPTFILSIPLNDDDVLTVDAGVSAYSSASSSNLDPFDNSREGPIKGSPWVASSGASKQDALTSVGVDFSRSSDDRNFIWSSHVNFAAEYDYSSIGFGGGITRLMNQKNTELSVKGNIYLDTWNPRFPIELHSYINGAGDLNSGVFQGTTILDQSGNAIDKNGANAWSPLKDELQPDKGRNSYTLSMAFSQILSKRAQFSVFFDLVSQTGWLSNPMQRVYFADRENFYVGNATDIDRYTSPENTGAFQLADDIERLPDSRFKLPIGARFNYYVNEWIVLRTYYRFYTDDWGIGSNTLGLDIPLKFIDGFAFTPSFRYYDQTAADYFAGYEEHRSTKTYYTSDYDLSEFSAIQMGMGVRYTDVFTEFNVWKLHLKNVNLKYSYYERDSGLTANIVSVGFKFVIE